MHGEHWQKQMTLDQLTQPECGNAANYFHESDIMYWKAQSMVLAITKPQTDKAAAAAAPTTYGALIGSLDTLQEQSLIQEGTSRPGCGDTRHGSRKPQSHKHMASLLLNEVPYSSPINSSKPVIPVSMYPLVYPP